MPHLLRRSTLVVAGLLLTGGIPRIAAAAEGTAPTFSKHVAPILYKNCVICHRDGEATPMSLMSYDTARPWAKAIKKKVIAREMPPWFADRQYGKFSNDPSLSQKEIDTIAAWVDAGAPKGNAVDLPPTPQFATGWLHPSGAPPDAIVEMPVEVKAPGTGEITNTTYYTPVPFAEDKFVEATQAKPGNRAFVHHSVVRGRRLPAGSKVDPATGLLVDARTGKVAAERGEAGVNDEPAAGDRAADRERASTRVQDVFDTSSELWLATYAPGWLFEQYKPGVGKRVPAGWYIGFNQHYTPTGKPESDRTSLALWFHKAPIKHELVQSAPGDTHIVEGRQVLNNASGRHIIPNVPPYAENWSIVAQAAILEPIAIHSFNPHMHLRGHDIKYVAVYPDGREETLFSVPKYDFNWQLSYENAEPVRLPAGSKLMIVGHLDNSVKNKWNPNPAKEVFWAEQSWDEMFLGFMEFTKDTTQAKPVSQQH